MVIIMTMTLAEFINDFSKNHMVQHLDDELHGVISANIVGDFYLIRLGSVNDAKSND